MCNEAAIEDDAAVGGNPLDVALWDAATPDDEGWLAAYQRVAILPFGHDRRRVSVVVDGPDGRVLVTKGAPEDLLQRGDDVDDAARAVMERELRLGGRVVAVASRPAPGLQAIDREDELATQTLVNFVIRTRRGRSPGAVRAGCSRPPSGVSSRSAPTGGRGPR